MTTAELGTLERVDVRKAWRDEGSWSKHATVTTGIRWPTGSEPTWRQKYEEVLRSVPGEKE